MKTNKQFYSIGKLCIIIITIIVAWQAAHFLAYKYETYRQDKEYKQIKDDAISRIEKTVLQEYASMATGEKIFGKPACQWDYYVNESNIRRERIIVTVPAGGVFDNYEDKTQYDCLKEAYDDILSIYIGAMINNSYDYYLNYKDGSLAKSQGYSSIENEIKVIIKTSANTYTMDDSDWHTYAKNGCKHQIKVYQITTDSSKKSKSSKNKGYSSGSYGWEAYDSGYDDVYFDGDYDEKRYKNDYSYMTGVDDAMEDLDEDW